MRCCTNSTSRCRKDNLIPILQRSRSSEARIYSCDDPISSTGVFMASHAVSKCCAPQSPRQFGEVEPAVFARDIVLKTLALFLKRSTKVPAVGYVAPPDRHHLWHTARGEAQAVSPGETAKRARRLCHR